MGRQGEGTGGRVRGRDREGGDGEDGSLMQLSKTVMPIGDTLLLILYVRRD